MAKEKKNENTDNKQKKTTVKAEAKVQNRRQSKAKTTENKDISVVDSKSPKRRSKAEIEAAKREKLERKLEREHKKAALEAKRKERADKKAAREAKAKAKIEAAAAKEAQKSEDAKIQKIIDGLKIDTSKYCAATPMTAKEKALVKKCLTSPNLVMSRCYQAVGGTEFHLLNWGVNEFIISVDNTYFFYNKEKNTGINFGSVFYTWLDTDKKNVHLFTEPEISKVNIIKQEAESAAPKIVVTDEQKKAIMRKMRGRR
jgi:hypothetical protein